MRYLPCFIVPLLLLISLPLMGQTPEARPNVLFIIADDLTANALGCYGNEQALTPNIDRLAQRGMLFERAYCQYPVCGPSRAALLSGLYPQQNGVTSNTREDVLSTSLGDHPTLPQHFRNNGYTTARIGKLYHMGVPGDITAGSNGADHPASWSMRFNIQAPEWMTEGAAQMLSNEELRLDRDRHYGLGFGTAFYIVQGEGNGAEQHDVLAADKAIELMGQLRDQPFFLAVGFVRPHVPLVAPASYFQPFVADDLILPTWPAGDRLDIPRLGISRVGERSGTDTNERRREVLRAYYASVSFMDAQVGRLLEALVEQGLAENTIVVFQSDHGYHLGEHDFWQKMSLHEESARIPLIFAGPGVSRGIRGQFMTEAIDIYPSLCALAGLTIPERCAGLDLSNIPGGQRDYAYTFRSNGHLIRTLDWAYMRYNDGSEELYDMVNDPHQFTNLASDAGAAQTLTAMRDRLDQHLQRIEAR